MMRYESYNEQNEIGKIKLFRDKIKCKPQATFSIKTYSHSKTTLSITNAPTAITKATPFLTLCVSKINSPPGPKSTPNTILTPNDLSGSNKKHIQNSQLNTLTTKHFKQNKSSPTWSPTFSIFTKTINKKNGPLSTTPKENLTATTKSTKPITAGPSHQSMTDKTSKKV